MQEYSMIMSERDSVHKEIEKLQDEVSNTNSKMKEVESKTKIHDDEKRKLVCQIEVCSLFFYHYYYYCHLLLQNSLLHTLCF